MDALKEQAVNGITSSGNLKLISDKTDDEIKAAVGDLSSIRATDLQAKGREEVVRTGIMEELHVDYTNPLNAAHQKDAVSIAEASGELLGKVLVLFKEFGIDCRAAQGNKVIEPEYHIEIKKEQIKDTVYTKAMCEEPRNRYSCHDALTVRCHKRGMQWGAWQDKTIIIPYQSIPQHWCIRNYLEAKALWRLTINPVYHQEIAMYIASTTGVSLAQINVGTQAIAVTHMWDMLYPRDSQNVVYKIHLRDGNWYEGCSLKASSITFHYQYRSGSEICMEWVDEWDEVCGLES